MANKQIWSIQKRMERKQEIGEIRQQRGKRSEIKRIKETYKKEN